MDTDSLDHFISLFELPVLATMLLVVFGLLLSSYVKIVTVLSVLRAGFGVQSLPGVVITGGFALSLSFFVMYPTIERSLGAMDAVFEQNGGVKAESLRAKATSAALDHWRGFLLSHSDEEVRGRFVKLQKDGNKDSWRVVVPSFYVSELREAFATGLSLLLPFLVLDLCAASIIAGVGIQTIDAQVLALPFKLLLFVALDGWTLIGTNLIQSYSG